MSRVLVWILYFLNLSKTYLMKKLIFAILFLICSEVSYSCINEFNINAKGDVTVEDYAITHFYNTSFDKQEVEEWLKQYDLNNISNYKVEEQSDIGVQLLKLGEFETAVEIFERLVRENPSKYELNANLGTTYELLGKNELALKYIKKGLEINPDSHNGSEWIHVKILEAKIALSKNPNWLKTNKIVDLETRIPLEQSVPTIDVYDLSEIEYQLKKQLETRLPYTSSPDLFMALLFEELASFSAEYVSTSRAHGYGIVAQYFAPTQSMKDKLDLRIHTYKQLTDYHYNGAYGTDKFPELVDYIDTTSFYLGKNNVHWRKRTEKTDLVSLTKSNNSKTSWLIAFIVISIIGFFLWRTVIRNSKELDNFE